MRFCFHWTLSLALLALCLGNLHAADGNPAFTSEAEAGPDYAMQGEYEGKIGEEKFGLVITYHATKLRHKTSYKGNIS